jgi:hypothetical protein
MSALSLTALAEPSLGLQTKAEQHRGGKTGKKTGRRGEKTSRRDRYAGKIPLPLHHCYGGICRSLTLAYH